jgi:hypothetical protein
MIDAAALHLHITRAVVVVWWCVAWRVACRPQPAAEEERERGPENPNTPGRRPNHSQPQTPAAVRPVQVYARRVRSASTGVALGSPQESTTTTTGSMQNIHGAGPGPAQKRAGRRPRPAAHGSCRWLWWQQLPSKPEEMERALNDNGMNRQKSSNHKSTTRMYRLQTARGRQQVGEWSTYNTSTSRCRGVGMGEIKLWEGRAYDKYRGGPTS